MTVEERLSEIAAATREYADTRAMDTYRRSSFMVRSMEMDLKKSIEGAVTKAIHELIDYLRYNDVQQLDETEFAARLHELLYQEDPE